jgi:hypothetical protein
MWWGVLEKGQCLEGNVQYFGDYKNTRYSETVVGEDEEDYYNKYEIHENGSRPVIHFFDLRNVAADNYGYLYFDQNQLPVYAGPFIFGTTGNIILLIIIIRNKDMRTFHNMYILNLAISDIINLTAFFFESFPTGIIQMWLHKEFTCKYVPFCRRMSVGLSAYSVALYSFQRYRITVSPFQVRVSSQPKWRAIVATLCGVWLVAALFAVPTALSRKTCQDFRKQILLSYYKHVVIFELLVSCVLPLCVIAFCYIMTARHLVQSSRAITRGTKPSNGNTQKCCKDCVGTDCCFCDQLCALPRLMDLFHLQPRHYFIQYCSSS